MLLFAMVPFAILGAVYSAFILTDSRIESSIVHANENVFLFSLTVAATANLILLVYLLFYVPSAVRLYLSIIRMLKALVGLSFVIAIGGIGVASFSAVLNSEQKAMLSLEGASPWPAAFLGALMLIMIYPFSLRYTQALNAEHTA